MARKERGVFVFCFFHSFSVPVSEGSASHSHGVFSPTQVGSEWQSPSNPCIIRECVRANEEVFIQDKNVSCAQMAPPSCPLGTELHCDRKTGCCPSCHCGKHVESAQQKLGENVSALKFESLGMAQKRLHSVVLNFLSCDDKTLLLQGAWVGSE